MLHSSLINFRFTCHIRVGSELVGPAPPPPIKRSSAAMCSIKSTADSAARDRAIAVARSHNATDSYLCQLLLLSKSPNEYVENMKGFSSTLGIVAALIFGVSVSALIAPHDTFIDAAASVAAWYACFAGSAATMSMASVIVSIIVFIQLDFIPNADSMDEVVEFMLDDRFARYIMLPQILFMVGAACLCVALAINTSALWTTRDSAWVPFAVLAGMVVSMLLVYSQTALRRRRTIRQRFDVRFPAKAAAPSPTAQHGASSAASTRML